MKRIFCQTLLIFLIMLSSVTLADGAIIYHDLYNQVFILNETEQTCFINYKDGIQKMFFTVNVKAINQAKSLVWIFPIPSSPENIKTDIINNLPLFYGRVLEEHSKLYCDKIIKFMNYTQYSSLMLYLLYPSFLEITNNLTREGELQTFNRSNTRKLTTDVISAKNSDSLENYLLNKKLKLPEQLKKVLNEYMYKDYSFAISYISDLHNFNEKNEQFGVYVTFTTPKIYFPLKPTSIYKNDRIPITIYVLGYVIPETYIKLSSYINCWYLFSNNIRFNENFKDFLFSEDIDNKLRFTMITIDFKAHNFKEDLWINPNTIKPYISHFVMDYYFIILFILWPLISCISSLSGAYLTFNNTKFNKMKFFTFGLYNFFTLIGMIYISYKKKIDVEFTDLKPYNIENMPYKKIVIQALLISICILILIMPIFQTSREALKDCGDMTIPFLYRILLYNNILFYFVEFISLSVIFGALSYLYYKNKRIALFLLSFTIIFQILTYLLELALTLTLYSPNQ